MTAIGKDGLVLTVGMHRSGTSAAAGMLGALGCSLPGSDDRIVWRASNPEHHESLLASQHNEHLLGALGGAWDAPPPLTGHWVHTAAVAAAGASRTVLTRAFPGPGPHAWKDPRLCLLLPYWRRILPVPVRVLYVWRQPEAVARSLLARDRMPLTDGLALWERYNRQALTGLVGLPVLVVEYDGMVDDPVGVTGDVASWLGRQGPGGSPGTALTPGLRHQEPSARAAGAPVTGEQRRLQACLHGLAGAHAGFPQVPIEEESPDGERLLAARRRAARQRRRRASFDQMAEDLETTRRALVELRRSTSWRVTRPLRWASRSWSHRSRRPPGRPG